MMIVMNVIHVGHHVNWLMEECLPGPIRLPLIFRSRRFMLGPRACHSRGSV
jgi:hypothetical protein